MSCLVHIVKQDDVGRTRIVPGKCPHCERKYPDYRPLIAIRPSDINRQIFLVAGHYEVETFVNKTKRLTAKERTYEYIVDSVIEQCSKLGLNRDEIIYRLMELPFRPGEKPEHYESEAAGM